MNVNPEDEGSMSLRNAGSYLQVHTHQQNWSNSVAWTAGRGGGRDVMHVGQMREDAAPGTCKETLLQWTVRHIAVNMEEWVY
jgi:hypothetical protein